MFAGTTKNKMKAISIRQPFASLIVAGVKDIENRSWPTNYRGPVLIHAAQKVDKKGIELVRKMGLPQIMIDTMYEYCGGIIGEAEIVVRIPKVVTPAGFAPAFTVRHALS